MLRICSLAFLAFLVGLTLASAAPRAADLFNNTNTGGVMSAPKAPTVFTLNTPAQVTQLVTYHWNNGQGARPGLITLRGANGLIVGNYQTHGTSGQGGAANVNWIADVNFTLPAGTYTVLDSSPVTWSQNPQSGSRGFAIVRGSYLTGKAALLGGTTTKQLVILPSPVRPVVTTQPQPGPSTPPQPCHRTTNAVAELTPPCAGPAGTLLTIYVLKPLPSPLAGVVFKQGPIGMSSGMRYPPANMAVTVQAGPVGSNGMALVTGNGIAPGSIYRLAAPPQLCGPGHGVWTWDLWLMLPGGKLQGDIDDFTVQGC